jgi:ParB-like nuclease domain
MLRARRPKVSNNETFVKVSKEFSVGKPAVSCQSATQNEKTDERAGARQIEMIPLRSLKKSPRNARTHSKSQIEQIANSINRFGFITPIVVDRQNRIRAGHGRAEAAELIGLKTVPIIRLTDLSEIELRAYALADNRIAESAGWNKELLAVEIHELQIALPEIGLDLSITGFEPGEVDAVLTDFSDNRMDPADVIPEVTQSAIAKQGDLFILGNHRLIVGDARDEGAPHQYVRARTKRS